MTCYSIFAGICVLILPMPKTFNKEWSTKFLVFGTFIIGHQHALMLLETGAKRLTAYSTPIMSVVDSSPQPVLEVQSPTTSHARQLETVMFRMYRGSALKQTLLNPSRGSAWPIRVSSFWLLVFTPCSSLLHVVGNSGCALSSPRATTLSAIALSRYTTRRVFENASIIG